MSEPLATTTAADRERFSGRSLHAVPANIGSGGLVVTELLPTTPQPRQTGHVRQSGMLPTPVVQEMVDTRSDPVTRPGSRKGRKPPGYWQQPGVIEAELRRFQDQHGKEFTPSLAEQYGETALRDAVYRYTIKRRNKPPGYWQQPGVIEAELRRFQDQHGEEFSPASAIRYGEKTLLNNHYANSRDRVQRPNNYWQQPGIIDAEEAQFVAEHGPLTKKSALQYGETYLYRQVLKRNKEIRNESALVTTSAENSATFQSSESTQTRGRPRYWTDERIELAAEVFRRRHGDFSIPLIKKYGVPSGLLTAIYVYGHADLLTLARRQARVETNPLKDKIDKSRPFLSPEEIRARILDYKGDDLASLTTHDLVALGILYDVHRKGGYPGGYRQLREDFGLSPVVKGGRPKKAGSAEGTRTADNKRQRRTLLSPEEVRAKILDYKGDDLASLTTHDLVALGIMYDVYGDKSRDVEGYPGGYKQMRKDFGLDEDVNLQKPMDRVESARPITAVQQREESQPEAAGAVEDTSIADERASTVQRSSRPPQRAVVFVEIGRAPARPVAAEATMEERIQDVLDGERSWIDLAACNDPKAVKIFDSSNTARQKHICRGCVVGGYCLAKAVEDETKGRVYGGMTDGEREALGARGGQSRRDELGQRLRTENRKHLSKQIQ